MKRLIFEAPCFGFGPISTAVSLAKKLDKQYKILFLTFAEACDFLKESTKYDYLEFDTRDERNFEEISKHFSHDDIIITNTNVEFSTFLIKNDFKVITIDTLYWMWNKVDSCYKNWPYIISQVYYGDNKGNLPKKKECRPIIDYSEWQQYSHHTDRSALISFGGMSEPNFSDYLINYSNLIIEEIIKNLPKDITKINIIGGLLEKISYLKNGIEINVLGTVNPETYRNLLSSSKYVFLSPGLTGTYEVLFCKKPFCLLPGLNVSQIYQVYDFKNSFDYKYCIIWPEVETLINAFNKQSELESLSFLRDYLLKSNRILKTDFKNVIRNFTQDIDNGDYYFNDYVCSKLFNNEKVETLVENMLLQIENSY